MNMNFGANKTPIEVIKGGAFRGTCFGDIYSRVNGRWYRKLWRDINDIVSVDSKYYY